MSTLTAATAKVRRILKSDFDLRPTGNEPREALTDLITDARHYADHVGVDFFATLDASYVHYLAERDGVEV